MRSLTFSTSSEGSCHRGSGAHGRTKPWWALAGLAGITALTLVLYTWGLSRNGMANSYYAAAVKSATISWKAFFFGSLDPGSFITVDKPPLALWVMALSGRIFGFSSWSMLLPQALAGVGSVILLNRLVARWRGEAAGLAAAVALAVTPVATLIFRYNNPDALLVFLLVLAAWFLWGALERGSTGRLVATGALLGLAFLAKMLMALMVLPAFGLVYLFCAKPPLKRRLVQLLAALGALVLAGGWWVAVVELWPQASRPHVGGTTTDSWIGLIFSRSAGILDGSTMGANLSGEPGWLRIFNEQLGGQVFWLIPLALGGLVAGLVASRRAPRADMMRAGYLLWGLWTLVTIGVLSTASGTLHSYYTVVVAPGVAALAGAGVVELWALGRGKRWLAFLLPAAVGGSAAWSLVLLGRVPGYVPEVRTAVMVAGTVGAVGLLVWSLWFSRFPGAQSRWILRAGGMLVVIACAAALLGGPTSYSLSTVTRSVTGNMAVAGPQSEKGGLRGISGTFAANELEVNENLLTYLGENRGEAKYLVAVQSAAESVPIVLATGQPVVTIGGYKSRDPYPTVEEIEALVARGELRYAWLSATDSGRLGGSGAGSRASRQVLRAVVEWIKTHGTVVEAAEYGGARGGTLYYLSDAAP